MKKSFVGSFTALVISTICCVTLGKAASLGDLQAGQLYAQTQCAKCHSIVLGGNTSPVDAATPFQAIADTGGMTRTALFVFFRSPHPTMPNLIVRGDDLDNIIAYILSLRTSK